MADAIHNAISILLKESSLSENEMHAAVLQVMDGNATAIGLGMLLTALKLKGETVDEIVGAARALRERAIRIPAKRSGLLDTCGTGGDELHTFNVSTATAFVTAACGVPVAKHANRSVSSRSGSADVLESLGVRIDLSPAQVARAIDEIGIGFCFAPLAHGAMKYAAPVRKQLGFRTIFNMLGPLTNPAGAEFQLLGAGRTALAEKLAQALARLGTTRAFIVCGNDELDEVSLWGRTTVFRVEDHAIDASEWSASVLGLDECTVADLRVNSVADSAQTIRSVISGTKGPARNIVLANSAAALIVAQKCGEPREAVAVAAAAIDTGKAAALLERLIDFSANRV
jgi:anthranilate phosphoribosyltransferase